MSDSSNPASLDHNLETVLTPPRRFAHLHQHTQYSLLDGAARIKDLLKWVAKTSSDNPAVAMTDHGNMHGAVQFYKYATEYGVKPIIGYEAYVSAGSRLDRISRNNSKGMEGGYYHLTLLAKDFQGYQNLCKLASLAYLEGFYVKPRIDREVLAVHRQGIIAMSGCLGAEVPNMILNDRLEDAEERLRWYLETFRENYFIEIQNHGLPEQQKVNPVLKAWAKKYGIGMVATNDGHYVKSDDAYAHEVLLAIQTKALMSEEDRFKFPCNDFYVKSAAELEAMIPSAEWGDELYDNTFAIAEMCDLELPIGNKRKYQMPALPIPEGRSMAEELRVQVYRGTQARYSDVFTLALMREYASVSLGHLEPDRRAEVLRRAGVRPLEADLEQMYLLLAFLGTEWVELGLETAAKYTPYPALDQLEADSSERLGQGLVVLRRAEYESGVIIRMGFPDYFLIVADFINWAKDQGIRVGPGRGSGAGSLVAYALRITNLDPLRYGLLFERFLNPDRISMPDFDVDFSDTRRNEVINYVRDKYGDDKVAMISTYGTMSSRACFKDVARVLELPYQEADKLSKLVPVVFGRALSLEKARETVPDIQKMLDESENARKVFEIAQNLEGLTRHSSVHASGVIIGRERLDNLVPLMRAGGDEGVVCQYDMNSVEDIGLIKMDFLGLRTLSFLEEAVRIIKDSKGVTLEPDDFPLDDEKAYEVVSRGETKGIFQLEGGGITDAARKLKPRRIEDINALSALYRPGPMENIPTYIERHHGREDVNYDDFPTCEQFLRPILEETYGICVTGDTLVYNAATGARVRIDELKDKVGRFCVQGVNEQLQTARAPVTHWVCNGERGVIELKLRNGNRVKLTPDHKVLTEDGWLAAGELKLGDFIATPRHLHASQGRNYDRRQLRVLAYLLADGALSGCGPTAEFISKDQCLIDEYLRCLSGFDRIEARTLQQVRDVTRVWVSGVDKKHYHEPNSLVAQLRTWGLKTTTGGCRSNEKFVPEFVFGLPDDDIAFFLASYWDCDGHIAPRLAHIKTISNKLAEDIRTLLLRLGIQSTVYESTYQSARRAEPTTAYQITVYNLHEFQQLIAPHLLLKKMRHETYSGLETRDSVSRAIFTRELKEAWSGSGRGLMARFGFDRQHLLPVRQKDSRISRKLIEPLVRALSLPQTSRNSNVHWEEVVGTRSAGSELVYDITVNYIHNFIGNNIILHNCVYQEQIMQIASAVAGYSLGQADLLRRIMGKKKAEEMDKERVRFLEGSLKINKIPNAEANKLFDLLEKFANYGFNKSHSAAYAFISFQTAYIKAHYPVEFMAALLTVERRNSEKVAEYINDARQTRLESGALIEVLPPDINRSNPDFKVQGDQILFGLFAVKGLGEESVLQLLEERERGGMFKSLANFCSRMHGAGVNRRSLENLVKAGAFDAFGAREAVLESVEEALEYASGQASMANQGMDSLFGMALVAPEPKLRVLNAPRDEDEARARAIQALQFEKEAVGLYISGHPLEHYPGMLEAASCRVPQIEGWFRTSSAPVGYKGRKRAVLVGMISGIQRKPTKSGGMMARFVLTDDVGAAELVAFSRAYDKINLKLREDSPALVIVEIEPDGDEGVRVTVEELVLYEDAKDLPKILALEVDLSVVSSDVFSTLDDLLQVQEGVQNIPIRVRVVSADGYEDWELTQRATLETLERLKLTCAWLKIGLGIDGDKVLAKFAPAPKPWEQRGGVGQGQRAMN